jgi:hypothetical protein
VSLKKRWIALILAGGLACGAAETRFAAADDSNNANPEAARTAAYSTGKNGQQLEWVSPRPAQSQSQATKKTAATAAVRQVQYMAPNGLTEPSTEASRDARTVQSQVPLPGSIGPLGGKRRTTFVEEPNTASPAARPTAPKWQGSSGLEDLLTPRRSGILEGCPSPKDLKQISDLTTNIKPSEGDLPHDCPLNNDPYQPRQFAPLTFTWTASALCHKPLYFEDVQLERYGHMVGPWLQPVVSGARFFLTFPILPYEMGLEQPNECMYTLGYYRPGSCAPWLLDPIPLSVRGAAYEAGAWTGACYLFP